MIRQRQYIHRRLAAIIVAMALVSNACALHGSPKMKIDQADRRAFEALRAFQLAETAAFKAGAPWPSAEQHQQIGAKLSGAYTLVIDVAQIGLAMQPGDTTISAEAQRQLGLLAQTSTDLVALVSPAAGQAIQSKIVAVKIALGVLAASIQGGIR